MYDFAPIIAIAHAAVTIIHKSDKTKIGSADGAELLRGLPRALSNATLRDPLLAGGNRP